jgi:hypothetical protein
MISLSLGALRQAIARVSAATREVDVALKPLRELNKVKDTTLGLEDATLRGILAIGGFEANAEKLAWLSRALDAGARMHEVMTSDRFKVKSPISKQRGGKKGNHEQPVTTLFIYLRKLFMHLGGTDAISNKQLYEFTGACVAEIDGRIVMPHHARYRSLMKIAVPRNQQRNQHWSQQWTQPWNQQPPVK